MVIRVEGMRYDRDTQYAQLSLVYRFYRIDEQAVKVLAPINSTMRPGVMPYGSIMAGDWQQDAPWREQRRKR